MVQDSAGTGIADVHVSVAGVSVFAITGAAGAFRIANVPEGAQALVARRIGFTPESLAVTVRGRGTTEVRIRLEATAQHVAPVLVSSRRTQYTGRLRSFYERRDRGIGRFFTEADIAARRPARVSDLIRTVPGARVVQSMGQSVITFRDRRCLPLIWIDGTPATAAYLDPDLFSPSSLAGIELYPGPATIPPELMWVRGRGNCGVIALWTKVPEPSRSVTPRKVTAEDLSRLVASLSLFTADKVEVPAAPDSARPPMPVYPEGALRDGTSGRVVAEFIVEANGEVDMDSFAAVMSTDARFTESVRKAVSAARFRPAFHGGRAVRQLLQLPFTFAIRATGAPESTLRPPLPTGP
jgi:TonB family protein